MNNIVYSDKQLRIFKEWETTKNNLAIEAGPGSGKSFTIKELLKRTPSFKKSIFLAFNKSIAEELKHKLPESTHCYTLHSLGFRTLLKNTNQKYKVNELKNWILAKNCLKLDFKDKKKENIYLFTISKLVDLYRLNVCQNENDLIEVANKYNVSIVNGEIKDTLTLLNYLDQYNNAPHEKEMMIDFVDMLYLPTILVQDKDFPKYDNVFIDECLPYHMPVLLSNGESLPIGKIVDNKIPVEVYTYNEKTKKQEFCKVTNWSKSLNNKKMYKIKGHNKFNHNIRNFIVCTYNHKIFTKEKGFIYANKVNVGMTIQAETKAEKTQKYKITSKGREVLSNAMSLKNNNLSYRSKLQEKCNSGNNLKKSINRGGNGQINELQLLFLNDLNKIKNEWKLEFVVKTKKGHRNGVYPNHYKIDIANLNLKIAIELDGHSHNSLKRKEQDKKKDDLLTNLGWKVIRIKNNDLIKNYDNILNHIKNNDFDFCYDGVNCIVDLIVDSIEEIETKEKWVYDITVEKNHNFYANGILVHNCQDLNLLQWNFVQKLFKRRSRFCSVGDPFQSIYSFQGADRDVFSKIKQYPNTTVLPLSYSYRCGKAIVKEANKIFDFIESPEWQHEGEVIYDGNLNDRQAGDYILCRNNLPIIETFLSLLKHKKKAHIMGKDYGKGLLNILNKIEDFSESSIKALLLKKEKQLKEKGIKDPKKNQGYQDLLEKITILNTLHKTFNSTYDLKNTIENMFSDKNKADDSIVLSSIHKSKGLEAKNVYIIGFDELIPSKYAETELELYAESCLKYVAITRAINKLVFVPLHLNQYEPKES